jgi:hypothetical protein
MVQRAHLDHGARGGNLQVGPAVRLDRERAAHRHASFAVVIVPVEDFLPGEPEAGKLANCLYAAANAV